MTAGVSARSIPGAHLGRRGNFLKGHLLSLPDERSCWFSSSSVEANSPSPRSIVRVRVVSAHFFLNIASSCRGKLPLSTISLISSSFPSQHGNPRESRREFECKFALILCLRNSGQLSNLQTRERYSRDRSDRQILLLQRECFLLIYRFTEFTLGVVPIHPVKQC